MYRILIAICTRNRDEMLAKCIESICLNQVPMNIEREVLVVHNGPEDITETATMVDRICNAHGVRSTTISEPELGIPFARNTALAHANSTGEFTHLAFLDDDDYPSDNWLREISKTLKENFGFAAAGPQVPVFPEGTPEVQQRCVMHGARQFRDGGKTTWAATNNVVFSIPMAIVNGIWFAESFAKTGGSDKLFFEELCKATGEKLMWAANAVVYQPVPESRLNNKWVVARAYRTGITQYPTEARKRGRMRAVPYCITMGGYKCAWAGKMFLKSVFTGDHNNILNSYCRLIQGIGCVTGIVPGLRTRKYV